MNRAFASFDDCVYDAVVSACGVFDSAYFSSILASVLQRRQSFYNDGKTDTRGLRDVFLFIFLSVGWSN